MRPGSNASRTDFSSRMPSTIVRGNLYDSPTTGRLARGERIVDGVGDFGDRRGATGSVGSPLGEHGDHIWFPPRRVDDAGIVRDGRDVARLVGHAHRSWKPRGNSISKFLR